MEEFVLFCQRKAATAGFEAARFWEQRGYVAPKEGSSALCAESAALAPGYEAPSTSKARCNKYAKRDLLKFMKTGPTYEELMEWLLCTNVLYTNEL